VCPKLEIDTLCGLLRRVDGSRVTLVSKKAQALLVYLAIEHNRPQSRETLARLLCGDARKERSRRNLQQALSNIRQTYEPLITAAASTRPRAPS